jgi:hypothetical protein
VGHAADAVGAGQATLRGDAAAAEHAVEPGDAAAGAGRPSNAGVAPLPSRSKGEKVYGYVVLMFYASATMARTRRVEPRPTPWLTSPLQLLLPLSWEPGLQTRNGSVAGVRRRRKVLRGFMPKMLGGGG